MKEYAIIQAPVTQVADFEESMRNFFEDGWSLVGGLIISKGHFYQAVAR